MGLHALVGLGDMHKPHNWEYATAAARVAATGFVTADLHKLALQLDDNTLWMLVAIAPITWVQMNPVDPANASRLGVSCRKATAGSIAKGKAVYITGLDLGTGLALVEKADASDPAKMPAIGVLDTAITEAVAGVVVYIGGVVGVDTSAWSFNDSLYVSASSPGDLTNVRPVAPHLVQLKAFATYIDATNGVLGVASNAIETWPNLAEGKIPVGAPGGGLPTTTDWAHATRHQSGGGDAIKLDDLAAPDDTADLDVSTAKHGLTPKAPNDVTKFLRGDATWAVPVPSPPTIIQGSEDAEDTTTSTGFVQAYRYSPTLEVAKYLVLYSAEVQNTYAAIAYATEAQIQIDDATTIAVWWEPGSNSMGYSGFGGAYVYDCASAGVHNFDFDFRTTNAAGTAKIRRKRIVLVKVTA